MVTFLNKNIKLNSFTHINCSILLACIYLNNFNTIYCITICWSWTIFITFHSAYIYDKTAYSRIRKKINCNFIEFHIANIILHDLPCIFIYLKPPNITLNNYHALYSFILLYIWIYKSTNKSMDLSKIYIKFNNIIIKKLYLTSIISLFSTPYIYNILITRK